jgi:hypothetical protein
MGKRQEKSAASIYLSGQAWEAFRKKKKKEALDLLMRKSLAAWAKVISTDMIEMSENTDGAYY